MEIKHTIGVNYTREEVIAMYGEEFFAPKVPRPIKPKIKDFSEFDDQHMNVFSTIARLVQDADDKPIECWAFGSRVRGDWMLPEEDPKGRGSDWDVFTTATTLPNANMLESAGLSGVRVDFRTGNIPPKEAVKIPS